MSIQADDNTRTRHFIRTMIERDAAQGLPVHTRFPPEPNGYLHIGHAKAICLNFGMAEDYGGLCNLRFDDTNPQTESSEFSEAIARDIRWLGFDWQQRQFYASDYFEQLYDFARQLIDRGRAYVCELGAQEMTAARGTLTEPGRDSPWRERPAEESLALLERMRDGEYAEGERVLRARIDMASPNMHMRDPVLYRIRKRSHFRTGDRWCLYPTYDFAHCLSDAIEGITHSLCSLEFEEHRALYDFLLDNIDLPNPARRPRQTEFSRLQLDYCITSKRKLRTLVEDRLVSGWDDPRMPTLSGMRRRGYRPGAIRDFCERVGVTRQQAHSSFGLLENCIREDLQSAPRAMAVIDPLKIVLLDYPEGEHETLEAPLHPQEPSLGTRQIPFERELLIERADFMQDPPKKFFRLRPGGEVRLRYAYIIRCEEVVRDAEGRILELHCTHSPERNSARKVKGVIHWAPAQLGISAEVRLYDRLFLHPEPDSEDLRNALNPDSIHSTTATIEPALASAPPAAHYQFERLGYFFTDPLDSAPNAPVFNRVVTLRDTWTGRSDT